MFVVVLFINNQLVFLCGWRSLIKKGAVCTTAPTQNKPRKEISNYLLLAVVGASDASESSNGSG